MRVGRNAGGLSPGPVLPYDQTMTDAPQDHARLTPYELVFGGEDVDDRLFPPIEEEARAREIPVDDPDRFLFLTSVGKLLRGIAGDPAERAPTPEASEAADMADEAGELMRQYGRLLYHAFHFWRTGKNVLLLETAAARELVDATSSVGDWSLTTPAPAGYVQLPRHLFWAAPAPGMKPEPADGFFWAWGDRESEAPTLQVLVALGLRPDRPGLSVVPAEGVLDDVSHWAGSRGREDGPDFASTMPGGDMDRLYSLETATEVLKLASLCFWQATANPETLGAQERTGEATVPDDPRRMPPSELTFRRIGPRG